MNVFILGGGVDINGVVWTWGNNECGVLGVGDFQARSSPFPLAALKNKHVTQLACGLNYAIAISTPISIKDKILQKHNKRAKIPLQIIDNNDINQGVNIQ